MFRPSGSISGKMSWTRFFRNVNAKSLRFYGTHLLSYCRRNVQTQKSPFLQSHNVTASRGFCDSETRKSKLPMLREDCYEFPSMFRWLRVTVKLQWATAGLMSYPHDFDLTEFLEGCVKVFFAEQFDFLVFVLIIFELFFNIFFTFIFQLLNCFFL